MMKTSHTRFLLLATAVSCGLGFAAFSGCNQASSGPPQRPTPTVTVAQPIRKEVVEWDSYTGRLEPIEFVEIRARVSGYLQSIHFDEGQLVKAGDLLFVIDTRPFVAELNGAKAALNQAQSQLAQANAQMQESEAQQQQASARVKLAISRVTRARTLRTSAAISQDELDQHEAEIEQAQADVAAAKAGIGLASAGIATAQAAIEAAQAGVEAAELNLSYTQIHAPVSGRISREYVTEGNLVSGGTATSTLLTTITSIQPIYCTFDVNEAQALKYIRLAQAGKRESSRSAKNPVYLGLADEQGFPHQGHMDFVDNRFDNNTASMRVRCIFRNERQDLVPGMFARVRLPGSAAEERVLIPDSAIGTDQSTQFAYVVVDGKIERRDLQVGPLVDGLRVVREGLNGDEALVVEGLLMSRPGIAVNVEQRTIEIADDGLPDTYQPLPPDQWISAGLTALPELDDTANASRQKREKVQ
ncbi:efflux RND transporter periplasmic adaptor subunit [Blastopirellula sp. JC732]|uniref:Efflux RND transporter periplasmic adaptor subunit n=1 Tax=Blastopirellula sediminis TaxID=2894196 RepID=A0A9X1MSY4_9BACT|nr:efflux RND transporter periplasmic adaptor subunit [Blastopirellula sediminis]MCC9604510.1 efflux RND transporter periplasmic adaptor subunit [Blastopirellula sediminis]MCC9632191.1 efflux RND transporter periplasmic adaptor subunit [Blastopirellula sediminis]